MKIAFDHQIFALQSVGGISRYFVRLAESLLSMDKEVRVVAPFHCNSFLDGLPKINVKGRQIRKLPDLTLRLGNAANRCLAKQELNRFMPDILHETYYGKKAVTYRRAKRVLTVYDMIHERFPGSFSRLDKTSLYKRAAVDRADHIISISHSTKNDLCEIFDVEPEKVSVVHLGFEKFCNSERQETSKTEKKPFLLYVGERKGYKNFEGMLRAVACRKDLFEELDIIAFGGGKFSAAEKALIKSLGFQEQAVSQIGGSDKILGKLYCEALALVYPSHYEGFGLPPLEAMAHGCPVIASNTSSMPEVIGKAGEFFSPHDIEDQAQAIYNVVFDGARQKTLILEGAERLNHFSWDNCAANTLNAYMRA